MLAKFCSQVYIKQLSPNQLEATYVVKEGEEFKMHVLPSTMNEVVSTVEELHRTTMSELNARFSNVGVSKYIYVLHPSYREPRERLGQPLAPAMKAFAEHFHMHQGDLTSQFRHLLKMKEAHLLANPQRQTLPVPLVFLSLLCSNTCFQTKNARNSKSTVMLAFPEK